MKIGIYRSIMVLCVFSLSQGCVKLALQSSPSLIPNLAQAVFEECDPDLAKASLPADLKLMEGLLKSDPKNTQLLTTLCMGFAGYALLFIEEDDPQRASRFYERALEYGFRGLGFKGSPTSNAVVKMDKLRRKLPLFGVEELESLFWATMSWHSWINLNLDKPVAFAQLGTAEAFLERILEIKPDYFYGTPYVLMGSLLAAKPAILGGNAKKAKFFFDKALSVSHESFFLVHYQYAKFYAVRTQNKALFFKLAKMASEGDPSELGEVCLINAVMSARSKRLMETSEKLFF